jgi:hypothetical protein
MLAGCGECETNYLPLEPNANIKAKPKVELTVPTTAKDGETVTFSVATPDATPVGYQWSFTAPNGAGNNPQVNFATPNAASTTATAHWFASPNQPCSSGTPSNTDPYYNSQYKIKVKVTFQGGQEVTKEKNFVVNTWVDPAGYVHHLI